MRHTIISLALLNAFACSANAEWKQWAGNRHWYKAVLNGVPLKWEEAQAAAVSQGGYLATITSEGENNFVYSLVDAPQYFVGEGPWLGARAPEPRGDPADGWHWVTGEPWSYTNWFGGGPTNTYGVEDALCFITDFQGNRTNKWNDFPHNANELGSFQPGVSSYVIERNSTVYVPKPTSVHVDIGTLEVGVLASLFDNDHAYFQVRSTTINNPNQAPITVTTYFTSPVQNPRLLSLTLRNHVSRIGLNQQMLLFNFKTGLWDVMDFRLAPTSDATVTANAPVPSNYVKPGTRAVWARWRLGRVNGSQNETWRTYTERIGISITS